MYSLSSPEALRNKISGRPEEKGSGIFLWILILILIVLILLKAFVLTTVYVSGDSMVPSLIDGQYLVGNRMAADNGNYTYGDIVVVTVDVHEDGTPVEGGKKIIKRIVGLEGDVIDFKNGALYRNGVRIDEPYLKAGEVTVCNSSDFPYRVKAGDIFLLGDNRTESRDSRSDLYREISRGQVYAVIPNWAIKHSRFIEKLIIKT